MGPPGGDNPPGRTRRGGHALVGCAHTGAPLRWVLALEILIIGIKNPQKVLFPSENFYFLHIKQHHGNSAENNVSPGLVSFKSCKLESKTRGKVLGKVDTLECIRGRPEVLWAPRSSSNPNFWHINSQIFPKYQKCPPKIFFRRRNLLFP